MFALSESELYMNNDYDDDGKVSPKVSLHCLFRIEYRKHANRWTSINHLYLAWARSFGRLCRAEFEY